MGIVRHKQNARLGARPRKSATSCGNILLSASPRTYGAVAGTKADRTDELFAVGVKHYLGVPVQHASVAKPFSAYLPVWTAFGTLHLGSGLRTSALVAESLDNFRVAIVLWRGLS